MFDKNKQVDRTTPTQEATVSVSKVRDAFARIVRDGNFLRNENGGWLFTEKAPFTGLNLHASYASEDQAIQTLIGIYFPEAVRAAA